MSLGIGLTSGNTDVTATVDAADIPGQISFHPGHPAAAGEFLVKFKAAALPGELTLMDGTVQTSQASTNAIFARLRIKTMTPVFHSAPPQLEGIHRVRFEAPVLLSEALEDMASDPNVEWVQPNYLRRISTTPDDPRFASQWALEKIQAAAAWDISQGDADVVIAVIDTGVDYDHRDLADNIWHNPGEIQDNGVDDDGNGFLDDYIGWDFVSEGSGGAPGEDMWPRDNDPMDFHGHGTHCAGIASAVTNNDDGVAGIGWNCRIMALRAGYKTSSGGGLLMDSDTSAALRYAADQGADVISMSWGDSADSFILGNAIQYAYDAGSVLVAAAGNGNTDDTHYPAAYSNVMAVASSNQSDGRSLFSSGASNYGSWVDIAAPGTSIISTSYDSEVNNNTYILMSGTSMATPLVAGAAGLLLSHEPSLTAAEVVTRLVDTGDEINWGVPGPTRRMNAYEALIAALLPESPTNLNAAAVSRSQIDLTWDNISNESGYEIERKETGGVYAQIDTTGVISPTIVIRV